MKTIIARFEDMKKDPMAILEDGVSANKVEAALATIGIALRNSEGEFRALQDVMDELGMKWNSLTRNQQAYIATVAAGSRQQSRFLALMNNYDRTLELVIESQNSAGAAAQQYATYQDSIAAAQARLTASWEKFYSKIVDNSVIKIAINGLSNLLEVISKIPPIITAIGASFGALALQNVFKLLKPTNNEISKVASGFKDLYEASKKNAGTMSELVQIAPEMGSGLNLIKIATDGIKESFIGATKATIAFIGKNLATIGSIALVVTAIAGLIYVLNSQKRVYEENINKIKEYQEESNNLANKTTNAEKLIENYEELASKVNRTEEEQNELNSTIQQIASIYPEAIYWIDEYGNSHLENVETLKEEIELEKQLAKDRERSALKQREQLLEKPLKEWKEEDFNQIGFNSGKVSRYFNARQKYNEYSNLSMGWTQNQLDKISNYFDAYQEVPWADNLISAIDTVNNLIEKQHLEYQKLNRDTATWDEVLNLQKKIQKFHDDMPKTLEDLKTLQNDIIESLKRENSTKLSFLDLVYSDKQGTATSQKIIASKLESFITSLGTEAYNSLIQQVGGSEGLTEALQKLIDNVDIDNSIEVKELADKLTTGVITDKELAKFYELLGIIAGDNFTLGIEEALSKQKEKIRQDIIEAVKVKFNGNEGGLDLNNLTSSNETLTAMTQMPTEDYNINATQALELAPAWIKYQEKLKKATETGNFEGIVESIEKIANDFYLTGILKSIFFQAARDGLDDAINGISDQISQELQEEMDNTTSIMGKDYSNINVSEAMEYSKKFGNNFLDHISMDENGKITLDIYGKMLAYEQDIEEAKQKVLNLIRQQKQQYDLIEDKQSQEAKNLKNEIESWQKIYDSVDQLPNKYRELIDLTEDLKKATDLYNKEWEKIGKNAKNNADALQFSSDVAKDYSGVIKTLNKLEQQMKDVGSVSRETMDELTSHGAVYQDFFTIDNEQIYFQLNETIKGYQSAAEAVKDIANKQRLAQLEIKKQELLDEAKLAEEKADNYDKLADLMQYYVDNVISEQNRQTDAQKQAISNRIFNDITETTTALKNVDARYEAIQETANKAYQILAQMDSEFWKNLGREDLPKYMSELYNSLKTDFETKADLTDPIGLLKDGDVSKINETIKNYRGLAASLREYANSLKNSIDRLKPIDPTIYEEMADKLEQAGKAGDKAGETIAKAIAEAAKAIVELNELIDEVKKNLDDITVDYNPFTDLFEAWEHEWDYYYNIKRLLQQIDTQGQYIDNIISSDYASADQKLEAQHAKVGNILAKMAANDTYITALRAGMSQTAVELMQDYGEYYKVDPETGQIYQTDKNLTQINDTINDRRQEILDLQRLQNEKENDLALENGKLEALEKEKDAYKQTLSIIESQLDSLKDNEDIIADTSGLESQKIELEGKINDIDVSIDAKKDVVEDIEDEIQNIDIQIELKGQTLDQLENYVDKMEDKVSEYEEYWENLNSTIAEQQELLQELTEIKNQYIETAISTEQELYNAIVENYQREIDQKKKQYDYLKQLDNEYLQSVKDNINKERQAREDANKQKSYQQNIQRAQLLQMDTSGAYRSELASLNKEIESQREDLYDDLVDKQVEALEKEIEKRHELYDKEVAALEERLAYMQENAILLWEMVNGIVAEGSEAMMAILENTAEFINSNELQKQQQREAWEYNVKTTFEGTQKGVINTLNGLVDAGNEFIIDKYPEVGNAIDDYKEVFSDAESAINNYSSEVSNGTLLLQQIFTDFMTSWNTATTNFTGYASDWNTVIGSLITQTQQNIQTLQGFYTDEGTAREELVGSIGDFKDTIDSTAEGMYQDFIEERRRYRDELTSFVSQIETEIGAAIQQAASNISSAANSVQTNPDSGNNGSNTGGESGSQPSNPDSGISGPEVEQPKKYKAEINSTAKDSYTGRTLNVPGILEGYTSRESAENAAKEYIKRQEKQLRDEIEADFKAQGYEHLIPKIRITSQGGYSITPYKKGGLNFKTGLAWLDGTSSNPERILSPKQTKLFESMVSSLEKTANNSNINSVLGSSYNIGDINTNINVEKLDNETDIDKIARQVENRIMKSIRNRVSIAIA